MAGADAICPDVAGDAIGWTSIIPHRSTFGSSPATPPVVITNHIATLNSTGIVDAESVGPANGTAYPCPAVAAGATDARVVSNVTAPPPDAFFFDLVAAPLWLASPGAAASEITPDASLSTIALAPDGSGVVAWLRLDIAASTNGPSFVVEAARVSPNGTVGLPQQLAGPSGDVNVPDVESGPQDLIAPVATATPDGSVTVAYALPTTDAQHETVQVSIARPGSPFVPAQTLFTTGINNSVGHVDDLTVASGPNGASAISWSTTTDATNQASHGPPYENRFARQPQPGTPYAVISQPFPSAAIRNADSGIIPTLVLDAAERITALATNGPGDLETGRSGGLWALRASAGQPFGAAQQLSDGEIASPSLAVAPDGTVVAAWVQTAIGPGGGLTSQAVMATAAPGMPFGPPIAITAPAQPAEQTSVTFDATGIMHVAWMIGTESPLGAQGKTSFGAIYASTAQPGAPDPLAMTGPRVALALLNQRRFRNPIHIRVTVDRPCLLSLQAVADGKPSPWSDLDSVLYRFTHAESLVLPLSTSSNPHPHYVRVVAYASTDTGASSAARARYYLPAP